MAFVESCSESPRTSISYDFGSPDASAEKLTNQSSCLSNVASDFCFQRSNDGRESLSAAADELFLDGKILPAQINRKIDNGSSKKMLKPILVVPPFPPLQSYIHTNNSRRHCSEMNRTKIGNNNQESPSSDNSSVISVKLQKKVSAAKLMQSKSSPPLHDLLYGTKTSVSNKAVNSKSSFKAKTGAGNAQEQRKKDMKSKRRSPNCCGLKFTGGNGVFGVGFCPFPLIFRSYSEGSVQNSSKIVFSSARNSRINQQNPMKLKDSSSPHRNKSPSLKELILTDYKLHSSLPVRNRNPSLKQLIVRDCMME